MTSPASPFRSALPIGTLRGMNINPRSGHNRNTRLHLAIPTRTEETGCMPMFRREGEEEDQKEYSISVQGLVIPPGCIQVKSWRASNRFTASLASESNGWSLSAQGVRGFGKAKISACSSDGVRPLKGIRVALMLKFPNPHPLCFSSSVLSKLYIVAWVGVGGKYIAAGPYRGEREISKGPTLNIYICAKMIKWLCSIKGRTVHCCSLWRVKRRSIFSVSHRLQFCITLNTATN